MFEEIIQLVAPKLSLIIANKESNYFYIEKNTCNCSNDKLSFTDAIDGTNITLKINDIEHITTFGGEIYPDNINDLDTFFQANSAEHERSNTKFSRIVSKAREYNALFKDSGQMIRNYAAQNDWRDMEFCKVLGLDEIYPQRDLSYKQGRKMRDRFKMLVYTRLDEALSEIDESIAGVTDRDFIKEANAIKEDLKTNVDDFIKHINQLRPWKMYNHWPTLLNPSPFASLNVFNSHSE